MTTNTTITNSKRLLGLVWMRVDLTSISAIFLIPLETVFLKKSSLPSILISFIPETPSEMPFNIKLLLKLNSSPYLSTLEYKNLLNRINIVRKRKIKHKVT
jgi:hypothetical protein